MQDEINLKAFITLLWLKRKIIATVTFVGLSTSVLLAFVLPETYETETLVMVNEIEDVKRNYSAIAEQVKSNFILNKLMVSLELDKEGYTLNGLKDNIQVSPSADGASVTLKVTGTSKKIVSNVANSLANEMATIIQISSMLDSTILNKKRLREVEDELTVALMELDQINKELETTEKVLVTKKSLTDENFLLDVSMDETERSASAVGGIEYSDEEINPVYTALKGKQAETSILITKLETEKEYLQSKITTDEQKIAELQSQQRSSEAVGYGNYSNKNNAIFIIPSQENLEAISPKKSVVVALGLILSFGLAVLIVLLIALFKRDSNFADAATNTFSG
ncbi:Wzz/FepE/Etk N-terminal domain-containing protein [Paenibacillus sp.]|uniref:Wzz/FepE/Etk N-terminal domain-containing protein n=1 Tax=Paenibacillus sp. TaxID=58172 RepID=UPI002D3A5D54|nr:Wzz/FepE/Etk N-terminal domain-containing protein [Paenibacillus sp.]HZG86169.1 Wzz/FepE/Etk N-terminal domain-containing protein [Paenibacillus sp.]